MPVPTRRLVCLPVLLVLAAACGDATDVVVRGDSLSVDSGQQTQPAEAAAGGAFSANPRERCVPGLYSGPFVGFWDASLAFEGTLEGDIDFSLRETLEGEFLEVTASAIEGETEAGVPFSFNVVGACSSGEYETKIANGQYTINETTFPFVGEVTGHYELEERVFSGKWFIADANGSRLADGAWLARRSED